MRVTMSTLVSSLRALTSKIGSSAASKAASGVISVRGALSMV